MIWKTRWLQVTSKEDRNTNLLTCLLFLRTYRLTTIKLLILDPVFMSDISSALFCKVFKYSKRIKKYWNEFDCKYHKLCAISTLKDYLCRKNNMIRSTTNKLMTTINKLYKRVPRGQIPRGYHRLSNFFTNTLVSDQAWMNMHQVPYLTNTPLNLSVPYVRVIV